MTKPSVSWSAIQIVHCKRIIGAGAILEHIWQHTKGKSQINATKFDLTKCELKCFLSCPTQENYWGSFVWFPLCVLKCQLKLYAKRIIGGRCNLRTHLTTHKREKSNKCNQIWLNQVSVEVLFKLSYPGELFGAGAILEHIWQHTKEKSQINATKFD